MPTWGKGVPCSVRAVSNALAHKELIPQVSLEAKTGKGGQAAGRELAPRRSRSRCAGGRTCQKTSGSPVQVQNAASSGAGSVYTQSAPPRPSFVNELMPDWLKERRKEQEKRSVSPAAVNPHQTENTVSAGRILGPAGQLPDRQTPARQTPDRQAPARRHLVRQLPGQTGPAKQFPARQPTARQRPVSQTPARQSPVIQNPV